MVMIDHEFVHVIYMYNTFNNSLYNKEGNLLNTGVIQPCEKYVGIK